MKPHWEHRIEPLKPPFKLRLLNGMTHPVTEAVVVVTKVTRHPSIREYRFHLGRVLSGAPVGPARPEAEEVASGGGPAPTRALMP